MRVLSSKSATSHRATAPRGRRNAPFVACASEVNANCSTTRRTVMTSLVLSSVMQISLASVARADEEAPTSVIASTPVPAPVSASGKQVYFDVKIGNEPAGRIVVELFDDVKVGAQRFADLTEEKQGVGYRLSKFNGIYPTYIRNDGAKSLSYSAQDDSSIAGGDSTEFLENEMDASTRKHSEAGLVSLIVKEATERPVKEKLVAINGKFVTIKEQAGEAPNGSAFTITTAPTPDLDATNLIVGRVVSGMDLVQKISQLDINKDKYDSPFFKAGKAMGDKRAITAEKGFNRPFVKVVISKGGYV